MPKVTAPLFSLTASGTLDHKITYMNTQTRQVVRYNVRQPLKRSTLQQAHGARVADCRTAWRQMTPAAKVEWRSMAAILHMTGPALWAREWFAQNIFPPAAPLVPI